MDRALRVLHVIEKNRLTTGSVVQLLEAARGLSARGHELTVASPTGGDLEAACAAAGLRFVALPLRHVADPSTVLTLRRLLRRRRPEIVHVHKGRAHAAALLAAARLGRLPWLIVNRGVSFPLDTFNKWKYRHPRVGAIVCVADAIAEAVVAATGIRADRVHTIHGGTDCAAFNPGLHHGETIRSELGLDRTHLVIGQMSVRDWKGWSDVVSAFSRIAGRLPDARLLLVGSEPEGERAKVDRVVRDLGLDRRVLSLPFRTDMPEILAGCDVVVDASRAGTGITGTIREAMAMQRAVVATDCGGNRELVIDGEVGLLVPPREVDDLAEALTHLLEDPGLRQRLGKAARKRVIEHFSTEKRIDKLEALYRSILE